MKSRKLRRIAGVVVLLGVMTSGWLLLRSSSNDDFKLVKSLEIYYSLFRELNLFYVDETNPEKLVENSIRGMLEELDPYTTYIPESDRESFNFMTTGQYGGIGSLIRKNGDYPIIAEPYEDFPAARAGLRAGDTLLSIDGVSVKGMEISKISEKLKGKPNTSLKLQIKRLGHPDIIEKTLVREEITINNVPYYGMLDPQTGYIRLANFTTGAAKEVKAALAELKQQGSLESLVLDLRGNPGGLLVEAVDVANIFVPQGQEIVSTRGRVKRWDQVYRTRFHPVDTTIRLAVLVSRGSASASEIVAGSLQDLDRAVIVGHRTFGKGLVQTTRELSYNTRLKVTTAKYYIPSGRCIQALDYSNRNEDGSVGAIPDSLISEYLTRNGRTVRDGGGIEPDFKTETEPLSQISVALYTRHLIFDYATLFASRHESIPPPAEFKVTDEMYRHFKQMVKAREFTYSTQSEDALKSLIETAKREKYYALAAENFEVLESKLAHDDEKDLNNFRDEIEQLIKEEISVRYYYQWGKLQARLEKDPEVDLTLKILSDPVQYSATLNEPVPVHARETSTMMP